MSGQAAEPGRCCSEPLGPDQRDEAARGDRGRLQLGAVAAQQHQHLPFRLGPLGARPGRPSARRRRAAPPGPAAAPGRRRGRRSRRRGRGRGRRGCRRRPSARRCGRRRRAGARRRARARLEWRSTLITCVGQASQEAGRVARAGADLEHALVALQVERLEDRGDDPGLGDRLLGADRQRRVGVGELAPALGDEASRGTSPIAASTRSSSIPRSRSWCSTICARGAVEVTHRRGYPGA